MIFLDERVTYGLDGYLMNGELGSKDILHDEVPEGWHAICLGELTDIAGGTTPKRQTAEYWEDGSISWATPTDITAMSTSTYELFDTKEKITEAAVSKGGSRIFPQQTVLMTSRATIGYVAVTQVSISTNQGFANFLPNEKYVPRFLCYLLESKRRELIQNAGGSTFKEISKSSLRSIQIMLPSFSEQERIAEILSSVDDSIRATEAVMAQAERVKRGMMEDLLTGGLGSEAIMRGNVPEEWCTSKLGDVCTIQAGAGFPIKHQGRTDEKYPFCKVSDMNSAGNEIFMNTANNTVSEEVRVELGAKILPAGTVIFPKVGAAIATNKKRIVTRDSLVDNNVIGIIAQHGRISERYLFYIMLAKNLSDFASTAGVPSIRKSTLEEFTICFPSIGKQNEIANTLSSVDKLFAKNLAAVNQLRRLKRGLVNDLLTGRVRTIS